MVDKNKKTNAYRGYAGAIKMLDPCGGMGSNFFLSDTLAQSPARRVEDGVRQLRQRARWTRRSADTRNVERRT